MNRPNPEMGVEVPKKQIKKDNKYQFEKAEKIEAFILSISYWHLDSIAFRKECDDVKCSHVSSFKEVNSLCIPVKSQTVARLGYYLLT